MTLDLAGITDPKATSGRGVMPSVVQCSPSRHRAPGFDHAWNSFVAWLESLFALHAVDSFASGLQLETRWRLGCAGYHGFLSNLLALECSLPEGVTWWQELRLRLDLAIKDRAAAAVQRNTSAKAAWAKKMRSIVHACKHLKGTQHKQTSCLIRPGARSSLTVMRNNHIIRALPNVPKSAFSQLWWDRASEVRIQDVPQALRVWTCSYCHKGIRDDPSLPEHVVQAAGRKHLYRCTAHKISLRDNLTRCSKLGLTRQVAGGTTSAGARVQQMKVDALPQGPTRHVATHVIFVLSHGAVAVTRRPCDSFGVDAPSVPVSLSTLLPVRRAVTPRKGPSTCEPMSRSGRSTALALRTFCLSWCERGVSPPLRRPSLTSGPPGVFARPWTECHP